MADRLHIKNRLFGYISAPYWLINAKLAQEIKNRMPIQYCVHTIFEYLRWRTAAILKIALSPYFSRELSNFDQIWFTDANLQSEHGNFTKNGIFDGRHIENRFLAADAKFVMEMKNDMQI